MACDFFNLEAEISGKTGNSFFVNLQQRSDLCFSAFVSLIRVEHDYSVSFCTDEFSFFSFILQIRRHQYCIFHNDTTFFRRTVFKFCNSTFNQVFFFYFFSSVIRSEVCSISVNLLVQHLLVDSNLIIRKLVALTQFDFDFRSQSYVKTKFKIFLCIEINRLLFCFVRHRFA